MRAGWTLVPCLAFAVNPLPVPVNDKGDAIASPPATHPPSTIPQESLNPEPLTIHQSSGFSRYQIILDRMPFGIEPAPLPPVTTNKPVQSEAATRNLKMCAVTRNQMTGKLQVGLVDVATKKNYFLNVGETEDGITVLDADYEGEKAKLSKDGAETWITMTDAKSMASVTAAVQPADAKRTTMPGITTPSMRRSSVAAVATNQPTLAPSLSERVKLKEMHEEARRQRVEEAEKAKEGLSKAQMEQRLRDYQMDLIRAGGQKGPPLPIPLTPEMDAQLVKEGVLPPQQ